MSNTNKVQIDPSKTDKNEEEEEDDWKIQFDACKSSGDAAFRAGQYPLAIEFYTKALSLDPNSGVVLSNRSAAYLKNNEKSKALHDAIACRENDMGIKGISRHAAALQALGRYEPALKEWNEILQQDSQHVAALTGKETCEKAIAKQKEEEEAKRKEEEEAKKKEEQDDDLEDFFNDVEEAAETVVKEKIEAAQQNAIKSHKKDLGTASEQIERLLPDNYKWYNLNPFHVLDLPHTATADDIAKRYKALSLLLHPDKNPNLDKAQLAYDEVLKAKETLYDETKANFMRQLIQQGIRRGKHDWEQAGETDVSTLPEFEKKAVFRLFAEREHTRRQVEKREQAFYQREQQNEDDEVNKEKQARQFDKSWKKEERVDKRIGNWRDFQKKSKKSKNETL